jgi:hypothetical protein
LVGEAFAGFVEQGGGEDGFDEVGERGVGAAEIKVLGEHVGEAGGVGEEIADADEGAIAAGEFGEIERGGVVERDESALDEEHEGDGIDGLGDGGQEVDGIGFGVEALVEDDAAVSGDEDGGGGDAAGGDFGGEEGGGAGEARGGHAGRFGDGFRELGEGGHGGEED